MDSDARPHRIARLATYLVAVLVLAGCASSAKLARKSQEQLAEGNPRDAYATALKAVEKDPYNEEALAALEASGNAVHEHHVQRFRSLAPMDTLAAADVAMHLESLRYETAQYGVTLSRDPDQAGDEITVRRAAARYETARADEYLDAGEPKTAYGYLVRAGALDPESAGIDARIHETHGLAMDRVLLLPFSPDTRARLDTERLSWDMVKRVTDFTTRNLEFTELADPGPVWSRAFGFGWGGFTRDAAFAIGGETEATRVAWGRIHGDRFESHSDLFEGTVYRRVRTEHEDGATTTRWVEVPVRVRIHDLWASVALDCEVHDVRERRMVARRTSDWGSGLRAVFVSTELRGDPDDYVLYTTEMWSTDRDACRSRVRRWSEHFGNFTVEDLVKHSRRRASAIVVGRTTSYGTIVRGGSRFAVCYGRLPDEDALLHDALSNAWKEMARALEEADRI